MTLTRSVGTRTVVVSAVGLIVASAVVTLVVLTFGSTASGHATQSLTSSSDTSDPGGHGSEDMPGMVPDASHGADDMPAATPTPAPDPGHGHDSGDVPGMNPTTDPGHGTDDMPAAGAEHGDGVEAAADRPLGPVLGTFGGGASAVMLTAGFLRRRDKARADAKTAARAARRNQS